MPNNPYEEVLRALLDASPNQRSFTPRVVDLIDHVLVLLHFAHDTNSDAVACFEALDLLHDELGDAEDLVRCLDGLQGLEAARRKENITAPNLMELTGNDTFPHSAHAAAVVMCLRFYRLAMLNHGERPTSLCRSLEQIITFWLHASQRLRVGNIILENVYVLRQCVFQECGGVPGLYFTGTDEVVEVPEWKMIFFDRESYVEECNRRAKLVGHREQRLLAVERASTLPDLDPEKALTPVAQKAACYIRAHPDGCQGKEIHDELGGSFENIRRVITKELYPLGFYNNQDGRGYFPPSSVESNPSRN